MGKSGVLEHKSSNLSETRKDRGKVIVVCEGPIGTDQHSFERYDPQPTIRPLLSKTGGSQVHNPHPKLQSLLSRSGRGEATDLKFVRNIHNFTGFIPLNILEKGAWAYSGTAQICWYTHTLLSQEQVKLRTSNFVRICIASIGIRKKSPLKMSGKVAVGSQRLPKIFMALIRAHRAVIFVIAQLSCIYLF